MPRKPLDLPPEFLHALGKPLPPTYKDHGLYECGECIHMRHHPGGVPMSPELASITDAEKRKTVSDNPAVREFYRGVGFCMASPPVPERLGVSTYPTTHKSWTCMYYACEAEAPPVPARPKPP